MRANVRIEVRERGKLMEIREGHNLFLFHGREWLAELISYSQFDPDVASRVDRIRYMGVGVGSKQQGNIPLATTPPVTTLYPAGYDPNATTGNEYYDQYPVSPLITTLERPVKLSGSTTQPYPTAPPSDQWLIDAPDFIVTHLSLTEATFHGRIFGGSAMLSGFFTALPLSEAALFTNELSVSKYIPYSPAVAYFSFDTIQKTLTNDIELIWSVRF